MTGGSQSGKEEVKTSEPHKTRTSEPLIHLRHFLPCKKEGRRNWIYKFEASTDAEKAEMNDQITKDKAADGPWKNTRNKRPKKVGRMKMEETYSDS